jgi:hypothetical protein
VFNLSVVNLSGSPKALTSNQANGGFGCNGGQGGNGGLRGDSAGGEAGQGGKGGDGGAAAGDVGGPAERPQIAIIFSVAGHSKSR